MTCISLQLQLAHSARTPINISEKSTVCIVLVFIYCIVAIFLLSTFHLFVCVFTTRLVSVAALADVVNSLCCALDFVSILVRDLNRELLLNSHDDFDGVQTVKTEIVGEVGAQRDL